MKRVVTLVWFLVLIACQVSAQTAPPLRPPQNWCDAGVMQGFPPEKQVTKKDSRSVWFPPNQGWFFQHTRELFPTKPVARGTNVTALHVDLMKELDKLPIDGGTADETTFGDFIKTTLYTDAIIVLHNGKIVYERYENCMKPETYHLLFSVSKSFLGLVAAIMASQDVIHENDSVSQYVNEMAASAYGDATLRQVMDMLASVKFSEDYNFTTPPNPQPDGICYLCAADWVTLPDYQCKSNLYEVLVVIEGT